MLVAASYTGRVARLFSGHHPEQVVGLVFVDAVHEDAFSPQDIADQQQQARMLVVGNWVLSRLGVARVLGPRLVPLVDGPVGYTISESTRELIAILSTRPKNAEGNARLAASTRRTISSCVRLADSATGRWSSCPPRTCWSA